MGWSQYSSPSIDYNCIAWALGYDHIALWPCNDLAWPRPKPSSVTVQEFIEVFALFGYVQCDSWIFEAGQEKIALYTDPRGQPTHAARQLKDGRWTSKLGPRLMDIVHDQLGDFPQTRDLRCNYGGAMHFFKRPFASPRLKYEEVAALYGGDGAPPILR
jgi:hypothetical protein